MSATVALVWWSRERVHTAWLARRRSRCASSWASSAAAASVRASSTKSTVCQGVSVPPQSNRTASTAASGWGRAMARPQPDEAGGSATDGGHDLGDDVVAGHVGALAGGAVLDLEDAVGD